MLNIHHSENLEALILAAARRFIDVVADAQLHGDGFARVILTGGGAGIGLLRKLAEFDQAAHHQAHTFPAQRVDWTRVHVFFGDERNVPVTHPESNEGQAREALLDHVAAQVHGLGLTGRDMAEAVATYRAELAEYAPRGFDIHLLGMGPEGHINSLFPHSEATAEKTEWVVAVTDSPKPPAERVTLTLPAIAQADHVWFLVSGAGKAEAAAQAASGGNPMDWPVAGARGREETTLFVTADAATLL